VNSTDLGQEIAFKSSSLPAVYIFCGKDRDPSPSDLDFIASILGRQSEYIEKATDFLLQEMRKDPHHLGIVPDDAERIGSGIPAGELEFLCRLDGHWEIQFAGIELEFAEELGVRVCFEGETPARVEDNADAHAWFDFSTSEWVED